MAADIIMIYTWHVADICRKNLLDVPQLQITLCVNIE